MKQESIDVSHTLHIFDFLAATDVVAPTVGVLFGDEPFLKQQGRERFKSVVLGDAADDTPVSVFYGEETTWNDVAEEVATRSLFGGSGAKRFVIVRDADSFVTKYRGELESYVAQPRKSSTLLLEVDSWAGNTKLYKAVDQLGLQVDCRPPETTRGKTKLLDEGRVHQWLVQWAKQQHAITLDAKGSHLLLELVGPVFGQLDQDLAKLALYVPRNGKVGAQLVQDIVGGWRAKTAFEMVDAAVEGDTAAALTQLERVLQSGEHPLAIFGPIAWSLRRYTVALRNLQAAGRQGKKTDLREALLSAGIRDWPQGSLDAAERRVKHLGRERVGKLFRWLFEIDLALKGSHSHIDRARLALEELFLKFHTPAPPPPGAKVGR